MVTIYGLKLERGKYYVGMTQKKFDRIDAHRKGAGAAWTKKYPPVDYEFVKTGMKKSDEDKLTLELMSIHGINNVRGGKWVQINLPKAEYEYLQKKVGKSSVGHCDRCGRDSHTRNKCYAKTTIDGVKITTKSWVYRPLKKKEKPKQKKSKPKQKAPKLTMGEKYALRIAKMAGKKSEKWMKENLPYYELLKNRYRGS